MRTAIAAAAALSVAVAAPVAAAGSPARCPLAAHPAVIAGTTWATITAAANPRGHATVAELRVAHTRTYPVLLGRGNDLVRWQATLLSLKPNTRYTIVTHAFSRGCSSESRTTFVTSRDGAGKVTRPATIAAAVATPVAAAEQPSPTETAEDWNW